MKKTNKKSSLLRIAVLPSPFSIAFATCSLVAFQTACKTRETAQAPTQVLEAAATNKGEDWIEEFEGGSPEKEKALIAEAVVIARETVEKNKAALNLNFSPRDAHPVPHGCLKGSFKVLDQVPGDFKTGLFATPKTYKLWARFSNAGLKAGSKDDNDQDGRGMALKVIGFEGQKLALGQEDTENFDINLVNIPTFPTETIDQYIKLQRNPLSLGLPGIGVLARLKKALDEAPINHLFGFDYFSITPFQLGKKAVKYRATPCTKTFENKTESGPDYLKKSMKSAFESGKSACFQLQAQLYVDKRTTPIETTTVEWTARNAPFSEPIARIEFGPENANFDNEEQNLFCERLSFNPWRVTKEHRPLGRLNRARQEVYKAASAKRHQDSQSVQSEPTGDETF